MINTYQTSLAPPPPLPPRHGRPQPILIPGPVPTKSHSKHLIRFLVGVVVAHLLLSVAAFLYLYSKHQSGEQISSEGRSSASSLSSEKRKASTLSSAHMVNFNHVTRPKPSAGHIQWDMSRSSLRDINPYRGSWLTVLRPGEYYVYSSVTFSKGDPSVPLVSQVKVRDDVDQEERVSTQASCYLRSDGRSNPGACTATQGRLVTLRDGNQLSVWVSNLSLVDYRDAGTTFGMYRLSES